MTLRTRAIRAIFQLQVHLRKAKAPCRIIMLWNRILIRYIIGTYIEIKDAFWIPTWLFIGTSSCTNFRRCNVSLHIFALHK